MSNVICTDDRFEVIAKYKAKLLEKTNIETSADEMAVIDNILFRMWQIGWLDRLEQPTVDAVPVVHGEWIFDGKFMELHRFHCSKCMRTEFRMSDYCPNCGARMDGERKDGEHEERNTIR